MIDRRTIRPIAVGALIALTASACGGGAHTSAVPGPQVHAEAVTHNISITWVEVGPRMIPNGVGRPLASGKIQAFAVDDANPNVMLAGGGIGSGNEGPLSSAGAFLSTDGGAAWNRPTSGLTDPIVDTLWLDQSAPMHVLAGTWNTGIFRSVDGGLTWLVVGRFGSTCAFVQIASTIYAGTARGVAQSVDGGATWTILAHTTSPVRAIAAGGGALYAGLDDGRVLKSVGPTSHFKQVFASPNNSVWSIAVDSANAQIAYALEALGGPQPILEVTTDGGKTWSPASPPFGNQMQALTASPDVLGRLYVATGGALYESTNAANSWAKVPNAPWDIRNVFVIPGQPNTIFVGSDQGVYETTNGGTAWQGLTSSISSSLLSAAAVNGSTILTGVQDFSPIASFDGGSTWQQLNGQRPPVGEDGAVLIDPANPAYCYVYTTAGFQTSTDGCATFHVIKPLGGLTYVQPGGTDIIAVDTAQTSTVYAASQSGIYRSVDGGLTLQSTGWPFSQTTAIALDPTSDQRIFVGTTTGLWLTVNGGTTWQQSNLGGANGWPMTIAIDPANSSVVLVAMSLGPWAGGGVLRSADGGLTFAKANTGLSTKPPSYGFGADDWTIRFNGAFNPPIAALATSSSVYISTNLGVSWKNERANAVPSAFHSVTWSGKYLYVATFGDGLLRSSSPL